ncbi:hypothetical protein QBC39DRAFT_349892 [Podospora conica]|nr:hypothetical protein QBC39DRAFT_349892 [Schizothecium conicum]
MLEEAGWELVGKRALRGDWKGLFGKGLGRSRLVKRNEEAHTRKTPSIPLLWLSYFHFPLAGVSLFFSFWTGGKEGLGGNGIFLSLGFMVCAFFLLLVTRPLFGELCETLQFYCRLGEKNLVGSLFCVLLPWSSCYYYNSGTWPPISFVHFLAASSGWRGFVFTHLLSVVRGGPGPSGG